MLYVLYVCQYSIRVKSLVQNIHLMSVFNDG